MARFLVGPPAPCHRQAWGRLYSAYAAGCAVEQTEGMRDRVWNRINDPDAEAECLLAFDGSARVIGFAHYRAFFHPLAAEEGGCLDDLFVEPSPQSAGAARALVDAVADVGRQRRWTVIRLTARYTSLCAGTIFDRVAGRSSQVTYDISL